MKSIKLALVTTGDKADHNYVQSQFVKGCEPKLVVSRKPKEGTYFNATLVFPNGDKLAGKFFYTRVEPQFDHEVPRNYFSVGVSSDKYGIHSKASLTYIAINEEFIAE